MKMEKKWRKEADMTQQLQVPCSTRANPTSRIRSPKKSFGECKFLEYYGVGDRKAANDAVVEQTRVFSNLSQSA
jgi:hypothetical protein